MSKKFVERSARVIVVNAGTSVRSIYSGALKDLGFGNIQGTADLAGVLTMLETEAYDWIITPMGRGDKVNALMLLDLILREIDLHQLKVSILCGEGDHEHLPYAFERGLLSAHEASASKTDVEAEFKDLFARVDRFQGDLCRVSCDYLARILVDRDEMDTKISLLRAMQKIYKGDTELLFQLGETLLQAQHDDEGRQVLRRVKLINPGYAERVDTLLGGDDGAAASDENLIGVESVALAIPDGDRRQRCEALLAKLGVPQVHGFPEANALIEWWKAGNSAAIVVFDWDCPPFPGPALVQRLRTAIGETPMVAFHDGFAEADAPLLAEIGVYRTLPLAFEDQALFEAMVWTLEQETTPRAPAVLLRKMRLAFAEGKMAPALELKNQYQKLEEVSAGDKRLADAEASLAMMCPGRARTEALEAMSQGADPVACLNTLGKSCMGQRDFATAIQCFEAAQQYSPYSVDRMCKIAESHMESGDMGAYQQGTEVAATINPDSEAVKEVRAKGALVEGDTDQAKEIFQELNSLRDVLAFTNNRGVALIRCQDFSRGLDLYRQALRAIPRSRPDLKGLVLYNLALGFARAGKLTDARPALEEAVATGSARIAPKAKSLLKRVDEALAGKAELALRTDDPAGEDAEAARSAKLEDMDREILTKLKLVPGDFCCHLIFRPTTPLDASLTEKRASLRRRGKIAKTSGF